MASRKYAEGTEVPISRSREELERVLERFGATAQAWLRDDELHQIKLAFKRQGKSYRFTVKLVGRKDCRDTPTGRWERTDKQAQDAADQENRRRFRSLTNYVKALMDAADTGIISSEEALLPFLLLPSGSTVAEAIAPQIESALRSGRVNIAGALKEG